jgi:hypothetical protein
MTQRRTGFGSSFLNETRAKAFDLLRALSSHDGRAREVRLWHSKTPKWGAFLMALIATNTLVAAVAWLAVAAIRG